VEGSCFTMRGCTILGVLDVLFLCLSRGVVTVCTLCTLCGCFVGWDFDIGFEWGGPCALAMRTRSILYRRCRLLEILAALVLFFLFLLLLSF
jgi:hypothetical protein